ncbi:AAA family ATPase [Streptomyces chilikensis]|uniref:AAA family ATPase n=1 Tax=Streptomyces chilikensis TaxID=1194079 RepID=A0ABV3ENG4_9ACTN
MSAPLTPPPHPQSESHDATTQGATAHDAAPAPDGARSAARGDGSGGATAGERVGGSRLFAPRSALRAYLQGGPGLRAELRQAALVVGALTAAGLLLGLLWAWLAPRVPLVGEVADGRWVAYLAEIEGEQAVGADGTFTLLAAGFGLLSAGSVFLPARRGGVPVVAGLCAGGLFGSLVAWQTGVSLGPAQDVAARAREVGEGVRFDAPLELHAVSALVVWPVVALLVHLVLTALLVPRDEADPADGGTEHGGTEHGGTEHGGTEHTDGAEEPARGRE